MSKKFIPHDIGRFLVLPGRKLYGFMVKSKVKPGVLQKIVSIPAEKGLTILYVSFSTPRKIGEPITGVGFLDFTDSKVTPKQLAEEIGKLDFVEEVEIIKPEIEGFIADTISFPLMVGDNRAILLRDVAIKGLVTNIRKHFGSGVEAFLYHLGFETGLEFGKNHKKLGELLGIKDKLEAFKHISTNMYLCVGYGYMEVLKLKEKPPYAFIRIYHCFECELGKGAKKPYSHLVRGMIAGALTEIFGKKMTAREITCIAKGDAYCTFEVKPESFKI